MRVSKHMYVEVEMCAFMPVFMYVVRARTYMQVYVCACLSTYTCMSVWPHVYVYLHVSTYVYTYVRICTHACVYVSIKVCMYASVFCAGVSA